MKLFSVRCDELCCSKVDFSAKFITAYGNEGGMEVVHFLFDRFVSFQRNWHCNQFGIYAPYSGLWCLVMETEAVLL